MTERISGAATRGVPLPQDFTLDEVATALGMSTRWVRERIKKDGAEHQRYGHKIRFTAEQVEKLRGQCVTVTTVVEESITTGRKKAS